MKNRKQIDEAIRHMSRKTMSDEKHKKEGWKCKCDRCGNIQEFTKDFECEKCGSIGNTERSLIKYLEETK